jgi:AcrR family transcriptional regulator
MSSSRGNSRDNLRRRGAGAPETAPATRSRSVQAARTQATCRRLLAAAEQVFARDGFEAARLSDIASLAGYTRGAFYANFKSKEDIFFALLEDWVGKRMDAIHTAVQRHSDPHKQLAAIRAHYAELATDRRVALIAIEFRLYALRHPDAHARLRKRLRRMRSAAGRLISELTRALHRTIPVSSAGAVAALAAVSHGLFLEHLVDRESLSEEELSRVLGLFFDSLLRGKQGPSRARE